MRVLDVQRKIDSHWQEYRTEAKLILMEYSNFDEFMRELLDLSHQNFNSYTDFKYNGISVKRTTDLKRGQIEIYGQ